MTFPAFFVQKKKGSEEKGVRRKREKGVRSCNTT
jgi:hypothetical protein